MEIINDLEEDDFINEFLKAELPNSLEQIDINIKRYSFPDESSPFNSSKPMSGPADKTTRMKLTARLGVNSLRRWCLNYRNLQPQNPTPTT